MIAAVIIPDGHVALGKLAQALIHGAQGRAGPRQLRRRAAHRAPARRARRRDRRQLDQPVPHRGPEDRGVRDLRRARRRARRALHPGRATRATSPRTGRATPSTRATAAPRSRRGCSAGRPRARRRSCSASRCCTPRRSRPRSASATRRAGTPRSRPATSRAARSARSPTPQILDAYRLLASLEGRVRGAGVGGVGGRAAPGRGSRFARARRGCGVHGDRPRAQGSESRDRRDRAEAGGRRERRAGARGARPVSAGDDSCRALGRRGEAPAGGRRGGRRVAIAIAGGATLVAVSHGDDASALAPVVAVDHDDGARPPRRPRPTTTTTARCRSPTPPPAESVRRRARSRRSGRSRSRRSASCTRSSRACGSPWSTTAPGTGRARPMPGRIGNSVFAGHRVTHTHPFLNLDQLARRRQGRLRHALRRVHLRGDLDHDRAARPTSGSPIPTRTPTITLFACNPKHSAAQRIVVKGKLVELEAAKPKSPA